MIHKEQEHHAQHTFQVFTKSLKLKFNIAPSSDSYNDILDLILTNQNMTLNVS